MVSHSSATEGPIDDLDSAESISGSDESYERSFVTADPDTRPESAYVPTPSTKRRQSEPLSPDSSAPADDDDDMSLVHAGRAATRLAEARTRNGANNEENEGQSGEDGVNPDDPLALQAEKNEPMLHKEYTVLLWTCIQTTKAWDLVLAQLMTRFKAFRDEDRGEFPLSFWVGPD